MGCKIIAEAGVNHNGSIERALHLVEAAAAAGADIVKFQTFVAEELVTPVASKAEYQKKNTGSNSSQLDMLKALELSHDDHFTLFRHCEKHKIEFLSTPFDFPSFQFLSDHQLLRRIKVSSGELSNLPFLVEIGKQSLPIILSTGMAGLGDVELALGALAFGFLDRDIPGQGAWIESLANPRAQAFLAERVTLLHCTTEYPAPFDSVNLRNLATLSQAFGLPVGLSDHSEGIAIATAAVAMGATVVEKHFTLDKNLPGPDHLASLLPSELSDLVKSVRAVESALGRPQKLPNQRETDTRKVASKVIVARRHIDQGERYNPENLAIRRSGQGLEPSRFWELLGRNAIRTFQPGECIEI